MGGVSGRGKGFQEKQGLAFAYVLARCEGQVNAHAKLDKIPQQDGR